MKKSFTKALCLLVTLVMCISYAALPVFADTTDVSSQTAGEPAASDLFVTDELPTEEPSSGASEATPPQETPGTQPVAETLTGDTELLASIPLGQSTPQGDEPATGGSPTSLLVSINYPAGKAAIKQGDTVKLIFAISGYESNPDFSGSTLINGKTVENGIGAYEMTLSYHPALKVTAVTSNFTTSTTPAAQFDSNYTTATNELKMVGLFSQSGTTVRNLNETALKKTNGQFASVSLQLTADAVKMVKDGTVEDTTFGGLVPGVVGSFALVNGIDITEIPFSASPNQPIAYDTAAPELTVTDVLNDDLGKHTVLVPLTKATPYVTADPHAVITIKDNNIIASYSVKKGTVGLTVSDSDNSDGPGKITFELTEPATYTITATDSAGSTTTGMVVIRPRITGLSLALTGTTYVGDTYTITATTAPAFASLPESDKSIYYEIAWQGTVDEDFFTVEGNPSITCSQTEGTLSCHALWKQSASTPVKIKTTRVKDYSIKAHSASTTQPGSIVRASSNTLSITSPVKVLAITMVPDGKKTNLSSAAGAASEANIATVRGSIKTAHPFIRDDGSEIAPGELVTDEDFIKNGLSISTSTNSSIVSITDFNLAGTVRKENNTYLYDYTMNVKTVDNARGVCDVTLSCGDASAVTTFNVTNYNTTLTKMSIFSKTTGLDYYLNKEATFTVSLTDAKNASSTPVKANDCILYTSNSGLLRAYPAADNIFVVEVCPGAQLVTTPTKVTLTAELKDDPQGRKATMVYTVYPTERDPEVMLGIESSTNVTVTSGSDDYYFGLYAESAPASAQLSVSLNNYSLSADTQYITSANKKLVKFTSSNSSVATVSDVGAITVKGYGECFITVTAQDGSNTFNRVKVICYQSITALLASNTPGNSIAPGGTIQFKLTGTVPANSTNKLAGLTWSMTQCTDAEGNKILPDDYNKYFILDAKTGKLTSSANNVIGTTVTVTAKVPDKRYGYDSDTYHFIDSPITKDFTVTVAAPNPTMLSYFSALNVSSLSVAEGSPTEIKVKDDKFIDIVQWCFVNANGDMATSDSKTLTLTPTAADVGKGTLYASYMGKTLSIPVTVYNNETPKDAKLTLSVSGSEEYKLFDGYTSAKLTLTSTVGTTSVTVPVEDCIFTSSLPGLVLIDSSGLIDIDLWQSFNLAKEQSVTLTAAIRNDPYGRKATKTITVTPKILPQSIEWINLYSEQSHPKYEDLENGNFYINLDDTKERVYNVMVNETDRSDTELNLRPDSATQTYAPGTRDDADTVAVKNSALAALSFSSSDKTIATVTAKGVVTFTGKPGEVTITAAPLTGTIGTKAVEAGMEKSIMVLVNQPYTISLNNHSITLPENPSGDVSRQLKATTTPAGGEVTWSIDDDRSSDGFTVDAAGKVTISKNCVPGDSAIIVAEVEDSRDYTGKIAVHRDECLIVVGEAGKTVAKVSSLTATQKTLTLGTNALLPFRSDAAKIGDITVTSSNPNVITVAAAEANSAYDDPKNSAFKGYQAEITPVGAGTASVTVTVSGSVYTETFTVYAFNPAGAKLVLGSPLNTQMLDSSNGYLAADIQVISSTLVDKSNAALTVFNEENNDQYLTFTSSNPNILAVDPDGTFYTRNLNTITGPVNVTITAAIKGEPKKREGKITFKVTPKAAVATVTIISRESSSDYLKKVTSSSSPDFKEGGYAIYTDIGDPAAQRVFNLGAKLNRTDDTGVRSADSSLVSWASSNPKAASVDASGTVTVRGKGSALITATAKDGSGVKDTIAVRVNNTPTMMNSVPYNNDGTAQTITIPSGGSYTIPVKLNTGTAGDIYISSYELSGAPANGSVTIDKNGKISVKAGIKDDISGITAVIHLKLNKYYVYKGNEEFFLDNQAMPLNEKGEFDIDGTLEMSLSLPIQVVSTVSVKAITLFEAPEGTRTNKQLAPSSAITLCNPLNYQFYIEQTTLGGQTSAGAGAIVSIELLSNNNSYSSPLALKASAVGENGLLYLTTSEPGMYRLNITLGGKTVSYNLNVHLPWYKNADGTDLQPLTGSVKLIGSVVSPETDIAYSKICWADNETTHPYIRILPATGITDTADIGGYAGGQCTYTSSSPLVTVDEYGSLQVSPYVPKDTKVTITATLINDPAKHVVKIPITVTGQNLTRSITIKSGTDDITGDELTGIANNSTLRLTAQCSQADRSPSDNGAVIWSSSKTSVVTVDKTGKVTFKGAGTAVVTAKSADGSGAQATVTFTLKKNVIT